MNASLRRPLGVVLNRARPRVGEQRQLISACSIETRRLSITCLDALKGTGRNHLRNSLAFSFEQKNIVLPWATQCSSARRRSEEHTSELQSLAYLVCRLLLEKKKKH